MFLYILALYNMFMFKPRIVLSRCFLSPVRYNGGIVKDEFVDKLKEFVEFIDLCPEHDIGLGVPRPRIVLLKDNESKRLISKFSFKV